MEYFEKARNEIIRISGAENQAEAVILPINGGVKATGGIYMPDGDNFDQMSGDDYIFGFFVDEKNKNVYKVWYLIPHEEPDDWQEYLDTVDYSQPDACAAVAWDVDDPDIAELRIPRLDVFDGAWFKD